jgi:PAS domain S-box-containing protein
MKDLLHILHLEDLPDDAELVSRELRKGGLIFELKVAKSRQEFEMALQEFKADIILSDHSLPSFNSFEALKIVKERGLKIPFILITSATSEEIAVAVLQAGAWDYILKDRMQRLPTAVINAVERHEFEIERQRYLEEMVEFNNRYEAVSKATNDAIWDWDVIRDVIVWNHGIQTIFGYRVDQHIAASQQAWVARIHPDDYDRITTEIKTVFLRKEKNWVSHYQYLARDGSYRYVMDRAYVVYQDDKPVRMIGAMQDVTELTLYRQFLEKEVDERTRELKEALNKEKDALDMKAKFVTIASHEFRTPLSSISISAGFIKKYKDRLMPDEIDKKLGNIEKQVTLMADLLNDVLMLGKMEAGKMDVRKIELSTDIFWELIQEVSEAKGTKPAIRLTAEALPVTIFTDEKLIRNIVINLLTNGIKFSPNTDELLMSLYCDQGKLYLTVTDSGIGIPPEDLKILFSSFSRASNSDAIEGTGLGLSIVKKAVDLLHGSISVKSTLGKGTTFDVVIPVNDPDKPAQQQSTSDSYRDHGPQFTAGNTGMPAGFTVDQLAPSPRGGLTILEDVPRADDRGVEAKP